MAEPRPTNRRTVLKTLGAGAVGSLVTVGTAAAGDDTFANQLNTVRASTRKYRDVQTARANGYQLFGVVKFVGVVLVNPDNLGNLGHGEDPTLLFYAPTRNAEIEGEGDVEDTNTILAGLEYHVTREEGGSPPNIFDDENANRNLKVTEAEGWHPNTLPLGDGGAPVDVFGLHVWAHLQNPDGVFALAHPTIRDHLTE